MSGTKITLLAVVGVLVVAVLWFVFSGLSVANQDADLRASVAAKQEANKASFDTVWKVLQQKAGIVDKYKNDFQEIWPDIIKGRYEKGSGLMQWVQERQYVPGHHGH